MATTTTTTDRQSSIVKSKTKSGCKLDMQVLKKYYDEMRNIKMQVGSNSYLTVPKY